MEQHDNQVILAVDDDPMVPMIIRRFLAADNYEILTAPDGMTAQKLLGTEGGRMSAMVFDWTMPGISGLELLQWVKAQPALRNIPVIMQTGMDSPEYVQQGIDAGAFYFLVKPIQKEVLRSIVRAAVTDHARTRALLAKIRDGERSFGMLQEGVFRFRTMEEADVLALQIASAADDPDSALFVSEILYNAVEHGLLGITYDEKTELLQEGRLKEEIARRLSVLESADRSVHVRYSTAEGMITVDVEDGGEGFDFQSYLEFDPARMFDNHGRGIALAGRHVRVKYEGNGSKVVVSIPGRQR